MGKEINLLRNYPSANRNLEIRRQGKTDEVRKIARKFDQEYFDGERIYGYGGFVYNKKYWTEVVKDFINEYKLGANSRVLDVGCAKGFMVFDFINALPELEIYGIDISNYALKNSIEQVREKLILGNAVNLPFPDKYFDLVISINTIHNLQRSDCLKALQEIQRVTKINAFITVDAYRNIEEKKRMEDWNLTALTIMSDFEWKDFFLEAGYLGDYYWFIP